MKILIIGSKKVWSIENNYARWFTKMGHDVTHFGAQNLYYDQYYKSTFHKIAHRLGLTNTLKYINKEILSLVESNRPDIVWVFKGMEVFPETLSSIKELGIKLVNYNPDHPFNYTFRGSGNKNVRLSIPIYNLHFTYSLKIKERIENECHLPCLWLPFGFNEILCQLPTESEEILKVCFIGTSDPYRISIMKHLIAQKISVNIYGNGWQKCKEILNSDFATVYPPVYGDEYVEIALRYRIQLNLFRPQNDSSHNMRTFEMPGMGSIMVAPNSVEHQILFKDNEEAFFFQNDKDLDDKIRTVLQMPYSEALKVRKNGIRRSIDDGYSYKSRSLFVISEFNNLLNNNI